MRYLFKFSCENEGDFEINIALQEEFKPIMYEVRGLNERTTSTQYRSGAVVWQLFSKSINQVPSEYTCRY